MRRSGPPLAGVIFGFRHRRRARPGWLKPWFSFWVNLQSPHPTVWAHVVAVLETLVALAIPFGVAGKVSYLAAAAFSVVIWAAAEGFGGPYTCGASDIGTAATASPAFPGSALWFLGSPASAGMHAGTLTFTASTSGTYHYLSPVPGQAQEGMAGTFIVSGS